LFTFSVLDGKQSLAKESILIYNGNILFKLLGLDTYSGIKIFQRETQHIF